MVCVTLRQGWLIHAGMQPYLFNLYNDQYASIISIVLVALSPAMMLGAPIADVSDSVVLGYMPPRSNRKPHELSERGETSPTTASDQLIAIESPHVSSQVSSHRCLVASCYTLDYAMVPLYRRTSWFP